MAFYIESKEVSDLLTQYAKREGKTKTAAIRDLLKRELKESSKKSPQERLQNVLTFVKNTPTEKSPIGHSDIHSLYEYLDAH